MLVGQTTGTRPPSSTRRCTGCGCRLNRYNDGRRCFACSRNAALPEAATPAIPPDVWGDRELQQALIERDFGVLCLRVRELTSMRQDDLALLAGLSQPYLSMLESGQRRLTNIDRIVALLDGMDVPVVLTGRMLRNSTYATSPRTELPGPSIGRI
ncbi:helix-turn-helix domain-containing protein [Streptomyces sp. OK228]|uniref:helix-turn-helix domain-containing protein n=1 Tax=Streptomyces sp. OK228 TaxID=1882786 RepID=UPI00211CE816|nr:helix-turn-helix transcriptional regulator [Streptomyces sp. OK228]